MSSLQKSEIVVPKNSGNLFAIEIVTVSARSRFLRMEQNEECLIQRILKGISDGVTL